MKILTPNLELGIIRLKAAEGNHNSRGSGGMHHRDFFFSEKASSDI